jgi:hypothetical protein
MHNVSLTQISAKKFLQNVPIEELAYKMRDDESTDGGMLWWFPG